MSTGAANPTPDLAQALRSHLAAHNLRVALFATLTLIVSLALWYALYFVTHWLALLFVTVVRGTEAQAPAGIENIFWPIAAGLLVVAWIDRQMRKDDRARDHQTAVAIVWEIALAIPRATLSVWSTLSAWQHLSALERAEAVALIERLMQERRLRLSSMPLEIPNSQGRYKILFALQLVQIIDVRREDRELWVTLNPLRPPALIAPRAKATSKILSTAARE